jgi:dipeptidyl aminopeptidase/acylaminoacyl peptidase
MKKLFFLSLVAATGLSAQNAPKPSAEEALKSHINYNPKDQADQLTLVIQEVYQLKTELTVSNFRQEYSDRIKMQRVYYPATTAGHETIPAYIFTPVKLPAGKKLPAIMMLHGGNHTQLADIWFPWIAAAVERGYVVMYPEYRGSSGHGDQIYENNYGVTDFADVMAASTYLASREFVDPARLGILGHSRGGMLTLRAIEAEPKRFAAAVELAALSDMVAFMGYKDENRREDIAAQKGFGGKLPDKNLPAYIAISPALFIEKIETPLLALSTTSDTTVPYQLNNQRVVEALKAYGKTFGEHLYHDAPGSHLFPFADSDEARDCMKRTFEWFGKYLTP